MVTVAIWLGGNRKMEIVASTGDVVSPALAPLNVVLKKLMPCAWSIVKFFDPVNTACANVKFWTGISGRPWSVTAALVEFVETRLRMAMFFHTGSWKLRAGRIPGGKHLLIIAGERTGFSLCPW